MAQPSKALELWFKWKSLKLPWRRQWLCGEPNPHPSSVNSTKHHLPSSRSKRRIQTDATNPQNRPRPRRQPILRVLHPKLAHPPTPHRLLQARHTPVRRSPDARLDTMAAPHTARSALTRGTKRGNRAAGPDEAARGGGRCAVGRQTEFLRWAEHGATTTVDGAEGSGSV